MDACAPVKGKCQYWREQPNEDDRYDVHVPFDRKRIACMCWVEGHEWVVTRSTVPSDCPNRNHCRYYVKSA